MTEANGNDTILVETIARHFPGARIFDNDVHLGVLDLRIHCVVNEVREGPGYTRASLFFWIEGGALGDRQVFASASGYEVSPEAAIVTGGCNWACSFGPVLRAGLAGDVDPGLEPLAVQMGEAHFDVFIEGLDRVVAMGEEVQPHGERLRQVRSHLGGQPFLLPQVARVPGFPTLPTSQPTVVSLFVSDGGGYRTVELKVDGHDVESESLLSPADPTSDSRSIALLRELAVFVPGGRAR